jgi:hypothetical protein
VQEKYLKSLEQSSLDAGGACSRSQIDSAAFNKERERERNHTIELPNSYPKNFGESI